MSLSENEFIENVDKLTKSILKPAKRLQDETKQDDITALLTTRTIILQSCASALMTMLLHYTGSNSVKVLNELHENMVNQLNSIIAQNKSTEKIH